MSKYTDNYERIFGNPKPQKGSWVIDPSTRKLIPRDEFNSTGGGQAPFIHGDLEAFVSPVDGSIIDDRGKLRDHNKRHGVTNIRDYGEGYFERRAEERAETLRCSSEAIRKQRRNAILDAITRHT